MRLWNDALLAHLNAISDNVMHEYLDDLAYNSINDESSMDDLEHM